MAKTSRKKASKKASKTSAARNRYDDDAAITVVGEHNRRPGSRYHGGFEVLRKAGTVGKFRAARAKTKDASELLRAAVRDGFVKIG